MRNIFGSQKLSGMREIKRNEGNPYLTSALSICIM